MLMTMEPDIQRNLENLSAYDMLQELKTLFAQQAEQELLQIVRDFYSFKQEEGQSEFDSFVQNYNMHSMWKTVNEFYAMLKLHEQTLTKKDPALHVIRAGKVQKKNNKQKKLQLAARGQNQWKGKNKLAYAPKPKIPPPPKRENPAKESICHQCGDTVCGCEALVKRDTLTKPDKLEPGSIKCIFVGYPKETMGYSFYYPLENKVSVARNAKFLDNSLITQEVSGSLEDLKIIQEEDTYPSINTSSYHKEDDLEIDEPQSDIIPICRSTRTRHALDRMCLETDISK
ncbi:hypothetical protein Tco_0422919 [Tanacetum coccineum]